MWERESRAQQLQKDGEECRRERERAQEGRGGQERRGRAWSRGAEPAGAGVHTAALECAFLRRGGLRARERAASGAMSPSLALGGHSEAQALEKLRAAGERSLCLRS